LRGSGGGLSIPAGISCTRPGRSLTKRLRFSRRRERSYPPTAPISSLRQITPKNNDLRLSIRQLTLGARNAFNGSTGAIAES
jgi:hypothetical protein